jgi:pyridoxamine 5'-phosphate oxidase
MVFTKADWKIVEPFDLDADPLRQLASWLEAARCAGELQPESMALATASRDGKPSVRMVIMRGLDTGLVFFTDGESEKGTDLDANPLATALFHWWLPVHRQVRVTGPVVHTTDGESDRYWATRPAGSRRSAVASHQSRVVPSREFLETAVAEVETRFPDEGAIARPGRWGGFRIKPDAVEFWEEGADRLHDRIRYRRSGDGWPTERLSP